MDEHLLDGLVLQAWRMKNRGGEMAENYWPLQFLYFTGVVQV